MTLSVYLHAQPDLAAAVAAGQTGSIMSALNAPDGTVTGKVGRHQFAMWAGSSGLRSTIEDHARNTASPLRAIALTLLDFLQGGVSDYIDLAESMNQQMLAAWVQAGAITQAQSNALTALAQNPVTRAERAGFPGLTIDDVIAALR